MWKKVRRGDQVVTIVRPFRGNPDVAWTNRREIKFYIRAAVQRFDNRSEQAAQQWHWANSRRRREEWIEQQLSLQRFEDEGGPCREVDLGPGDFPWDRTLTPPNIPVQNNVSPCGENCT